MEKKDDYPAKLFELKKNFRAAALRARDALSEQQRNLKSSLILERLSGMGVFKEAVSFFVYVSFASEVETHGLIRILLDVGKHVSVPCIDRSSKIMTASVIKSMEHDLRPGCFGILEPAPGCLNQVESRLIDVVIVPGAAFTTDGFRIGYGGGYYDRFLKSCPAVSVGIAFDMQVVDKIPFDVQWDVPLDYVVTESRIIQPARTGTKGLNSTKNK
jgi:5-formyltetrahydrofolate cyclo-ligase